MQCAYLYFNLLYYCHIFDIPANVNLMTVHNDYSEINLKKA